MLLRNKAVKLVDIDELSTHRRNDGRQRKKFQKGRYYKGNDQKNFWFGKKKNTKYSFVQICFKEN